MSVDASLRDTEDIPLTEDINEYFEREVLPFSSEAWVDRKKIRLAMKFPLRDFSYKYTAPEPSEVIAERIKN